VNLHCGSVDREGGVLCNEAAIPLTGPGTARGQRCALGEPRARLPEFAGELPVACSPRRSTRPARDRSARSMTVAGNPVLSTPNGRALSARSRGSSSCCRSTSTSTRPRGHAHLILPPASPLSQDHYDVIFNALAVRRVARLSRPLSRAPPTSAPTGRS
jgi:hypothetical protein